MARVTQTRVASANPARPATPRTAAAPRQQEGEAPGNGAAPEKPRQTKLDRLFRRFGGAERTLTSGLKVVDAWLRREDREAHRPGLQVLRARGGAAVTAIEEAVAAMVGLRAGGFTPPKSSPGAAAGGARFEPGTKVALREKHLAEYAGLGFSPEDLADLVVDQTAGKRVLVRIGGGPRMIGLTPASHLTART